jgi:NADPH-dependent glutamate synthase beta subunit-like oxidoreductase
MSDIAMPVHVVAIVGAAISGSVAARILAERGCEVVVFEQNDRPYGKIEDGLPRWHAKLRQREYRKIDDRLTHPRIHFVPRTRLGRDLDFESLARGWGFSALLLALGAWRDRPLDVPGVDAYVDRGLIYQNPFVYWFNHKNERAYAGPRYEVPGGTLCVGGGLASIDVMKIIQLEIYERALRKRGIETTMSELEHEGIATFCKAKGADPKALGVTDGLLIYRRRAEDMPLAERAHPTPEQRKSAEVIRKRTLEVAERKFLFQFQERRLPRRVIVEGERLAGLTVVETVVDGRKVETVPGSEVDLRAPLVISSIGSLPEKIAGLAMRGETYAFNSGDTGEYEALPGVFGLGNVVTGKGNIHESEEHGESVARHVATSYLAAKDKLAPAPATILLERARRRQREVGYDGDYAAWMSRNTPADLE